MGTEAVKKVKWDAHRALDQFLYAPGMEKIALDAVLDKIGVSWEALSWVSANPEAAKGLASGEMVACPKESLSVLYPDAKFLKLERHIGELVAQATTGLAERIAGAVGIAVVLATPLPPKTAASTPVPSDKAQGEKPDDGVRYNHEGEPWPT